MGTQMPLGVEYRSFVFDHRHRAADPETHATLAHDTSDSGRSDAEGAELPPVIDA